MNGAWGWSMKKSSGKIWTAGVDAGSRTIKAVVWDADSRTIAGTAEADQGVDQTACAEATLARALQSAGCTRDDLLSVVATGYGRAQFHGARAITEITCHARGVARLVPGTRMIVDIGGQDSKVIWLDESGAVSDFIMNDRCAAGTGRYIEMVAARLHICIEEIGDLASNSRSPATISSTCAVFAETELTGLMASGVASADLAAGVLQSISGRIASMAGGRVHAPVIFTGGVARIRGMSEFLSAALACKTEVAPLPLYTGALGAALIAAGE